MNERRIPLSVPAMLGNEARYLAECVETNWVSSRGAFVDRFEALIAERMGAAYAVACTNGTAALHVALLVAGVQPDDEVLVSDLTFVASANAVRYCGAWPVLIDAEPRYWQIDPEKIAAFLQRECGVERGVTVNRRTGRCVRAIMPAHILGHPADAAAIQSLARQFGLVVVADAAEALGTLFNAAPVARYADVSAVSFNGNKLVTAGGGGAVLTDDEAVARRARYLTTQAKDDELESAHGAIGFNYRLTNIQAALGLAQLERLEDRLASKRETAAFYDAALGALPLVRPTEAPGARSSWWLYTVLLADTEMSRPDVMHELAAAGIETRPLWLPVSRQKPYANCQAYHCDRSPDLQRRSISLPCSVGIEPADRQFVVHTLTAVLTPRAARAI